MFRHYVLDCVLCSLIVLYNKYSNGDGPVHGAKNHRFGTFNIQTEQINMFDSGVMEIFRQWLAWHHSTFLVILDEDMFIVLCHPRNIASRRYRCFNIAKGHGDISLALWTDSSKVLSGFRSMVPFH